MKRVLLEYLRCPVTKESLTLKNEVLDAGSGEITSGVLLTQGGRKYSIVDGVPIMLAQECIDPGQSETIESFSGKWKTAPNYRQDTKEHYITWYLERYGYRDLGQLKQFLSTKKRILDAGTGEGRDTELYSDHSNALVFGVDMSDGIFFAYRDLKDRQNAHLIKADLTRLPFEEGFFDFIACDQVIHHTKDTFQSLRCLLKHLGPGHIAIYVYKKKGPIREFCDDFIRDKSVHLSIEECMNLSRAFTSFGKALSEIKAEIHIPEDIPLLGIKAGHFDLQRWIYWNIFKCYWNEKIDWTSNVVTNFDWYHPKYAHRHTPDEVRAWFMQEGLSVCHFLEVDSGISVIGLR